MTIEKTEIIADTKNDEALWNEQMDKDSDVLDILASEAVEGVTDEDFEDEDW